MKEETGVKRNISDIIVWGMITIIAFYLAFTTLGGAYSPLVTAAVFILILIGLFSLYKTIRHIIGNVKETVVFYVDDMRIGTDKKTIYYRSVIYRTDENVEELLKDYDYQLISLAVEEIADFNDCID